MSTIRKRKDRGTYFLDLVVIENRNGVDVKVRRRVDLGTADKSLAISKARVLERDLTGKVEVVRVTFEQFEREYFAWADNLKRPRTIDKEHQALNKFKEFSSVRYLDAITVKLADDFVSWCARSVSPPIVNSILRTLRSIFSTAAKWPYLTANPFARSKFLRYEKQPP